MIRTDTKSPPLRRGALLVDASLILAMLGIIALVAVEVGWPSLVRQAADDAAYEAARRAIVPGTDVADAKAAASEVLERVGVETFQILVLPDQVQQTTTHVTVRVAVPIDEVRWTPTRLAAGRVIRSEVRLMTDYAPQLLKQSG